MEEVAPSEYRTRNGPIRAEQSTQYQVVEVICVFVAITLFYIISAGNSEGVEQCGPLLPEIPDPPPSYPLILDRDPVPEELVRSNVHHKQYLHLNSVTHNLVLFPCCQSAPASCEPGVGGLRVRLGL